MFELFRLLGNRKLFILLIVIVLFVALMGVTLGDRIGLTWPEKFVRDTVGFTQRIVNKPASSVSGFFEDVADIKNIYKEYESLRITIAEYERDRIRLNAIDAENKRLLSALKFTERQKADYETDYKIAHVVSVNEDVNNSIVVIDIGAKDGVEPMMAVSSIDGMVGVISSTTDYTSTVQLLTSLSLTSPDNFAISVTAFLKENQSFGIIESYDKKSNRLIMSGIKDSDPIAENDTIITSGSGGIFPPGIQIGKVRSVEKSPYGLTRTAEIYPAASFVDWKELFVVVPGAGDGTP